MSYEILMIDDDFSILHITEARFSSHQGWCIQFDDGKEALLYYCIEGWIQYGEAWLNKPAMVAIGNAIDSRIMEKTSGATDHFFYDILVN